MQRLSIVALIATLVFTGNSGAADHDVIDVHKSLQNEKLVDMRLADAIKLLGFDGVPWDDAYTNVPNGEARIYHFRDFCVHFDLQLLPQGRKPGDKTPYSFTFDDLRRNGERWLTSRPYEAIDGISDRKERMETYWKRVAAGLAAKGRDMGEFFKLLEAEEKSKKEQREGGVAVDLESIQGIWEVAEWNLRFRAIKRIDGDRETLSVYDPDGRLVSEHVATLKLQRMGLVRVITWDSEVTFGLTKGRKSRGAYVYRVKDAQLLEIEGLLIGDEESEPKTTAWKRLKGKAT